MSMNPPTPIPVGSPHVAEPPMFPRFGYEALKLAGSNRRNYARRQVVCEVFLVDRQSNNVLRCRTDDISDAGIRASGPIGYGLAVGQRYEVRIASGNADRVASTDMIPSLGFATVSRLEIDVRRGDAHRVGFALRFDVPQLIPV